MTQPQDSNDRAELTRLMRSIAREVAYEVLDEHIEECEHQPKRPGCNGIGELIYG